LMVPANREGRRWRLPHGLLWPAKDEVFAP
jgi:hypothetical protein